MYSLKYLLIGLRQKEKDATNLKTEYQKAAIYSLGDTEMRMIL